MKITVDLFPDEYLRVVRGRLELTQAELADRWGVERRTIMHYENGVFEIPPSRLAELMRLAEEV